MDVDRRVAQVSRAYGALMKAVSLDKNLKQTTKRKIYNTCVLCVLLMKQNVGSSLGSKKRN